MQVVGVPCYENGDDMDMCTVRDSAGVVHTLRVCGQFDYRRIVRLHSYNIANDKAYALSGTQTYEFLQCTELEHHRISKYDIKNIILGGGQNLLSPERRFDAVLVNDPDLFE